MNYIVKWTDDGKNILHWSAGCFPHEQVASWAHTQVPLLRPQQTILNVVVLVKEVEGG